MKKDYSNEELFRKFINNQCSPAEIEEVLNSLKTSKSAKTIYTIITQELQQASSSQQIDPEISEEIRKRILERIENNHVATSLTVTANLTVTAKPKRRFYWRMVAVFTGFLLLAGTGYRLFIYKPWVTHSTSYGEITTIVLPDSSSVILNGNSEVRYAQDWGKPGPREVWVEGEAFFSVKHTRNDRKFIVHPSEDLDVVVLGTEFNVYDRLDATKVVLNSGKIKLNIRQTERISHVDMLPGELVELHENSKKYEKRSVDPELYSSWTSGKLVLDSTSFREIAVMLEETYGLSVSVPDVSLYNERFSGTVPSENVEALLKALALSFNLRIKAEGNEVIFSTKSN